MAKALFGYVSSSTPAMAAEIMSLRSRVDQLEATVLRLRAENDRLSAAVDDIPLTVGSIVEEREPALT